MLLLKKILVHFDECFHSAEGWYILETDEAFPRRSSFSSAFQFGMDL
jgi:hypothetical protein